MEQARLATLSSLKELLWKVYELEETVRAFGPSSQPVLEDRLLGFLSGAKELSNNTWAFNELKIPVDLLRFVDEGGNPDQFTADTFRACLRDNQAAKGKVAAVSGLRSALLAELEEVSPQEVAEYKSIVKAAKEQAASR